MEKTKVLILGDLHFSDVYRGRYKDYLKNCTDVCDKITKILEDGHYTHFILTGDMVGVREKNLKHRNTLLTLISYLMVWNRYTNNNVYSLIGNHDLSGNITDFEVFEGMGLIKTSRFLQIMNKGGTDEEYKKLLCNRELEQIGGDRERDETQPVGYIDISGVRYHFVDYGKESLPLKMGENGLANVVICHNDIQVRGKTTWWKPSKVNYELSEQTNWEGVEVVVAGHIHNPSEEMVTTEIGDSPVTLVYVGCPTRPTKLDTWEFVNGMVIEGAGVESRIQKMTIPLEPLSDLIKEGAEEELPEEVEEQVKESMTVKQLAEILEEVSKYGLHENDIKAQIKRVSKLDTEAGELALKYYIEAEEMSSADT